MLKHEKSKKLLNTKVISAENYFKTEKKNQNCEKLHRKRWQNIDKVIKYGM